MKNLMNVLRAGSFVFVLSLVAMFANADESGAWEKKSQKIKGTWSIVEQDGGFVLNLSEDFKTRNAPDLKLVLTKASLAETNNNNALADTHVIISLLESNKGAQSYALPDDYADYDTLLIHCEKYSKLWGGASLK